MNFTMYTPTRLVFGSGVLNELHKQSLPGRKAMIAISNGKSTLSNGALTRTREQLALAGVETVLFNKVQANPLKDTVMEGAACARENGCDFIVALGGGSVLDASKGMAFMATNPGDLWNYVCGGTGKGQTMNKLPLPLVTIATTAGTGSEVNHWGVISNPETNEKIGFGGFEALFPTLALVDPELMTTIPPLFTAYQGFDALFHCTEVCISKFVNPMSEMIALTAIRNVAEYLPRAVKKGHDIEAREHVAFGSTIAGHAMLLTSTTAQHSMEHAMSAYHHALPHGAGLIMISKAFHAFFIEKHACDEQFIKMARAMGMEHADKPEDFITALSKLQQDCGVAGLNMSDYGITPDEFDILAKNARETMGGLFAANPCEMTHDDCVNVLRRSYR